MSRESEGFDILFRRAGIADGTGAEIFQADLAVKGDRIAELGDIPEGKARRVVEAEGLVLGPGFVDIHGHSDYHLLVRPGADSKLMQGVTTEVGGNCGYSAAPVRGEVAKERAEYCKNLFGLELSISTLEDYIEELESLRPAINFAPLAGYNTLRASAMGYKADPPSAKEMREIEAALEEALEQGAFGMSAGLAYSPACYSTKDELVSCARLVAGAGGFLSCHIRSEGRNLIESIEEIIEVAEEARTPLQLSHLKTSGPENWSKLDRVFEIIESAQERGLDIRADRYPYLAAFTGLASILPDWVFEGSREEYLSRLRDVPTREKIKKELAGLHPDPAYFSRVVIAEVFDEASKGFEGMNLTDAAQRSGKDPVEFLFDLLDTESESPTAVYHTMSEENLLRILKKDWVMAGSDSAVRARDGALSKGRPHPRAFGTYPRIISHVVREKAALSLEAAVRKMTSDPCAAAGIKDRGRIKEGLFADLVLFDPERTRDLATYDEPHLFPEGIRMVVVNGKISVEGAELTGERAGRVLRRDR